jgi:hypothetical protein
VTTSHRWTFSTTDAGLIVAGCEGCATVRRAIAQDTSDWVRVGQPPVNLSGECPALLSAVL